VVASQRVKKRLKRGHLQGDVFSTGHSFDAPFA